MRAPFRSVSIVAHGGDSRRTSEIMPKPRIGASLFLWFGIICAGCGGSSDRVGHSQEVEPKPGQESEPKNEATDPTTNNQGFSDSRDVLQIEVEPDFAHLCRGECIDILVKPSNGNPPYSFSWDPDLPQTKGPHRVCPETTTTFTVTVRDTGLNSEEFVMPAEEVVGQTVITVLQDCADAAQPDAAQPDATDSESRDSGTDISVPTTCEQTILPGTEVTSVNAFLDEIVDPDDEWMLHVGASVALSGDTLAVASTRSDNRIANGFVSLFVNTDEGWSLQTVLTPPAEEPDCWFGKSVALSGDILAVGAPEEWFIGNEASHGRIYVYLRDTDGWRLTDTLISESSHIDDDFGSGVSLSGDTLVSTSYSEPNQRVEIFQRGEEGFRHQQTIVSPDGTWSAFALDGDILAVSIIPGTGEPGQVVHIYERIAGRWEYTAELIGDRPGERFGVRLAVQGNTALVVDSSYASNEASTETPLSFGAVYVFERDCDGVWSQRGFLTGLFLNGSFGRSIAIDGGRIVISDPNDSQHASGIDGVLGTRTFDDDYTGAIYVFDRSDLSGPQINYIKPRDVILREKDYGYSIAADQDLIAVASPGEAAVYIYR